MPPIAPLFFVIVLILVVLVFPGPRDPRDPPIIPPWKQEA